MANSATLFVYVEHSVHIPSSNRYRYRVTCMFSVQIEDSLMDSNGDRHSGTESQRVRYNYY
jgi:hypothetical protein